MCELQLCKKLWIADLHDIDASYTSGSKLVNLKTENQLLTLSQDVIFANSYRSRSPMVTMSLTTQGYIPSIKDLAMVCNTRASFNSNYTILAGTYWENEIKDKKVFAFYNKLLKNDPAVVAHRNFFNNNESEPSNGHCDLLETSSMSKWSWSQSYSNFPFLLFTTVKPCLNEMSLQNRTEVDCIIAWDIVQNNKTIGKAFFLPYGIPDMVGEAGIAVFYDGGGNFKGICMSEKLRDSLLSENLQKYRITQELSIQRIGQTIGLDGLGLSEVSLNQLEDHLSLHQDGMDFYHLLNLLALCGDNSDSDETNNNLIDDESLETYHDSFDDDFDDYNYSDDDSDTDIDDLINSYSNHYLSGNGELYEGDEADPALVKYARHGDLAAVKRCTEASGSLPVNLNKSRKWTEVVEKWGYDKSWEWYDDTALIAAARSGHFDIVVHLLELGADPTLEACHVCDEYETALQAAEHLYKKKTTETPQSINLKNIIDVLHKVKVFWKNASYASSHYSNWRQKAFLESPNLPTDMMGLKETISNFKSVLLQMNQSKLAKSNNFKKSTRASHSTGNSSESKAYTQSSYCKSSHCNLNAAKTCNQNFCGTCCPGPCERHYYRNGKKRINHKNGSRY